MVLLPAGCSSRMRKALLPQATTIPSASLDNISPTVPDCVSTSARHILSGLPLYSTQAPGTGLKERILRSMISAGLCQLMRASSLLNLAA